MSPAVRDNLQQREEWITRINDLADQVESWCRNQGWTVVRSTKQVEEPELGTYQVPVLRARHRTANCCWSRSPSS